MAKTKKPKAIEVNVLELLKAIPKEFWAEVSVWSDSWRDPGLKDEKYVNKPLTANGAFGGQERVTFTPKLAEKYPEYMEFYKCYMAPERFPEMCYEEHDRFSKKSGPKHDWVELNIGTDARMRYEEDRSYGGKRMINHPVLHGDRWVENRDRDLRTSHFDQVNKGLSFGESYQIKKKILPEADFDKAVAKTWNRLRRKNLRELGKLASPKKVAETKKSKKMIAITDAKMKVGMQVTSLIQELTRYNEQLASGDDKDITRERIREIYDMTTQLTSLNKELRDTMGLK